MWSYAYSLNHPAKLRLAKYATNGCSVSCGEYWTVSRIVAAIIKGAHKSARTKDALASLHA